MREPVHEPSARRATGIEGISVKTGMMSTLHNLASRGSFAGGADLAGARQVEKPRFWIGGLLS
jgi:hypothetical protein